MAEYRDYQLQRINRCPIDIYVASAMPYPYPYKLMKPEHAEQRVADTCDTLIMDSGIGDDTTNRQVLELAQKYDADFVVPCDELRDQTATTEAVHDFLEVYDDMDVRATPLIPLQPPYDEHYRDLSGHYAYVLGGIAFDEDGNQVDPRKQVAELQQFRREAGPEPYAHALGVGGSMTVVNALANNPNLVQSVDCSTPEQAAINGSVIDAQLKQKSIEILTGDGSAAGRYALAETNAYQLNDAYTKAARGNMCMSAWQ